MLCLAFAALALQAAPSPPSPTNAPPAPTIVAEPVAVMFAGFDADGDARLTRAELAAGAARSFATVDTANAGAVGYIAFADWAQRWLGDRNAVPSALEVDRDGDNRITLQELQDRLDTVFARLDRDKDDILTRAELLTVRGTAYGDRPANARERRRR